MSRADRLRQHVASVDGVPVTWGVDDCSAWVAAWTAAEARRMLALPSYASRAEAHRLIDGAGGLVALWQAIADEEGFAETWSPGLGDVGLVQASAGPIGVIFAEGGFAFWRAGVGVALLRPRGVIKAWSLPNEVEKCESC